MATLIPYRSIRKYSLVCALLGLVMFLFCQRSTPHQDLLHKYDGVSDVDTVAMVQSQVVQPPQSLIWTHKAKTEMKTEMKTEKKTEMNTGMNTEVNTEMKTEMKTAMKTERVLPTEMVIDEQLELVGVANIMEDIVEPDYLPTDGVVEVEEDMKLRRARVEAVCRANPHLKELFTNHSIVSQRHKFLFCPVPKVGSTFWSRFFYQLQYTDPVRAPFDVPVTSVDPSVFFKFKLKDKTTLQLQKTLSPLTKLVYVRDPYQRPYSAYVDKVISPNPVYWDKWGIPAITKYRKPYGVVKTKCGHDMTFAEFAKLAVDVLWNKDDHMEPVYHRCNPCKFNFTVIGKMETFTRDAIQLASLLNISEEQLAFDRMEEDTAADAIYDSAKDSMSERWLSRTLKCITRDEVLRRILRKLHLRGVISWRFKYPFTRKQAEGVSFKMYVAVLTRARKVHMNKAEQKLQKKQAYREAFMSVPEEVLEKFDKIYRLDALFFGYENVGDQFKFKDKSSFVNTGAFDLTKPWDLSPIL